MPQIFSLCLCFKIYVSVYILMDHNLLSVYLYLTVLSCTAMTEEQDPPSYKAARKKDRERLAK